VHLTADIVARRPTVRDAPAIEAMIERCSLESRYARFLAPRPSIPLDHLARVVTPLSGEEAWVMVRRDEPETIVALGSWARIGDEDAAELALIVEDSWQRHGIGTSLLRLLGERAWSLGICRLTASVLTESRHVFRMLRAVFGPASVRPDGFVSRVTIDHCG
jgi:GNAT superfamily N-acetyltransferase